MTTCKFCGQQTNDEHPDWFPMTRTGTFGSEARCILTNECALRAELRDTRAMLDKALDVIATPADQRLADLRAEARRIADHVAEWGEPGWAAQLRKAVGDE